MMRLTRPHRLLLCGSIAALLYLTGLGRPALWEPDEGRYAEIAREMLVLGDYVTPHNDWVPYFEKPPLVYWATAASLKLLGRNEFAVRLQAALFSIGQVVVTAALGEAMFGTPAGLLGALALTLSPLFFAFARFATPDPALAFWITSALAAFFMASRAPHIGKGAGRLWMVAAAGMLALGTLAKGPVALVLCGGIALGWLIFQRRGRDALNIPWLACGIVYVAIAAPWFAIAARRNPGFLEFFFIHEHFQRYLANTEHSWGPWFFFPVVIDGTWPWFFFIPPGILAIRGNGNTAAPRGALSFLLIWFGLIFVFFSIPQSKLGEYMLPALPPLAIIAGCGIASLDTISSARARRLLGWLVGLNGALALAVTALAISALRRGMSSALVTEALVAASALLVGAAAGYLIVRRRPNHGVIALSPVVVGVLLLMLAGIKAREDGASMFSYRSLARAIAPAIENGCALASYRHHIQSLPFYTGARERLVGYQGELAPFAHAAEAKETFITTNTQLSVLWSSDVCVVLVANRNDIGQLLRLLKPTPSIIGCEGKKFALYNRVASPWLRLPSECRSGIPYLPP
jgi:4-amino-4-deoxy-L-arabinose transferase-like glycosyltransferase